MEAFYQIGWKQTVLDNCGTFFSTADVAADGCNDNYHILNKNLTQNLLGGIDGLAARGQMMNVPGVGVMPMPSLNSLGINYSNEGLMIPRGKDNKAGDSGQWGTAFRWLGDNTEYGAYFMNYHSRTPFLSMQNTQIDMAMLGKINAATNAVGVSDPSSVSNAVTPNVPAAPVIPSKINNLTLTSYIGNIVLSWGAPNDGGSQIADYVIEYKLSSEPSTWSTYFRDSDKDEQKQQFLPIRCGNKEYCHSRVLHKLLLFRRLIHARLVHHHLVTNNWAQTFASCDYVCFCQFHFCP